MLTFEVITLFPQLIYPHLNELPFKKAIELNKLKINIHQLRDYSIDKHNTVDDKPYGGGLGMVLMIEPLYKVLNTLNTQKIVILSPKGKRFTQKKAVEYSKLKNISLVCGRYEGIDNRILKINKILDNAPDIEHISIGNYVLSGGELPALNVMEATTRLLDGVLDSDATKYESHNSFKEEYPQYTRPSNFMGLKVPKILLSGDHKKIEEWKQKHSR